MTAYYNEYEPFAAAWLRELIRRGLIADGEVDERSILDVSADDLRGFTQCHFFAGIGGWSYALRLAGWPDDRPVWTGSPPCQPFSSAGQQKGKDDERHLAPHFAALVAAGRPPVLFGEQVASAAVFGKAAKRTGGVAGGEPEWAWIDDLFGRLEDARYACGAVDLPAAGVGAPHIRQRTFFGAVRLADARCDSARGQLGDRAETQGVSQAECKPEQRADVSDGRSAGGDGRGVHGGNGIDASGLADAADARFSVGRGGSGVKPGSVEQSKRLLADGWLADADGEQCDERLQPFSGGSPERAGRDQQSDRLGNTDDQGPQEHGRFGDLHLRKPNGADQGGQHINAGVDGGSSRQPRALHGGWADADWLFCRDGKWRPVEPGTFPLAHGVPGRVGRLRAYGNAIVPQAAAEVIKAFMEVTE